MRPPLAFLPTLAVLIALTALRLAVAAAMPLSADEAYYRVWAHALAWGYLDHPPMVALFIRAGTALAGETPLGIRLLGPLAALAGSLLLWRGGADLAPGTGAGRRAVWLLNGTLLLNAGAVTATPDTPLLLFWTACLAALARLVRTGQARWWLAAGAAAGLAFDSKYTGLLLAPACLAWLVCVPPLRPWLKRPAPYAACAVALLAAAPVLAWNAAHGWASFLRQGGRAGDWHPATALAHLAELAGGQLGLATPLLAVLFCLGIAAALRRGGPAGGLLAATTLVPACLFAEHALGDRVQANWPAILYPGAALAAALVRPRWQPAAVALGLAISGAVMLQAAAAPFALPRRLDFSLIRLAGWGELAGAAAAARAAAGADCLAADEYGLAAELAYHSATPVLGAEPRWAFFRLPPAPAACRIVLMVRSTRRAPPPGTPRGTATRARHGITAETYRFYLIPAPPDAVLLPPRLGRP